MDVERVIRVVRDGDMAMVAPKALMQTVLRNVRGA